MKKRGEKKSFFLLFFSWSLRGRNIQAVVYHNRAIVRPLDERYGWGLLSVLFQMGTSIEWPDILMECVVGNRPSI
jgi:hypothetical protein